MNKPKISDLYRPIGKKVLYVHTFKPKNPPGMDFVGEPISFSAFYKAEEWLKELGYLTGSMDGKSPIGFAPAAETDYISKWHNMTGWDTQRLHGVILSDDFRGGEVHVVFCESPLRSLVKVVQFKNVNLKKRTV